MVRDELSVLSAFLVVAEERGLTLAANVMRFTFGEHRLQERIGKNLRVEDLLEAETVGQAPAAEFMICLSPRRTASFSRAIITIEWCVRM
jgi:hypothetical protein